MLLYRLLSTQLTDAEQRLLSVDSPAWEHIIADLEDMLESDAAIKSHRNVLTQAFSHIDKATREGLATYWFSAGGFASGVGARAVGSAGDVVPRSSDAAAQSPAQSLVPLTVPTSLQPIGAGGFASLEAIVEAKPDFLLLSEAGDHAEDDGRAFLLHPALERVYPPSRRIVIPERLTVCGGPMLSEALERLASELERVASKSEPVGN